MKALMVDPLAQDNPRAKHLSSAPSSAEALEAAKREADVVLPNTNPGVVPADGLTELIEELTAEARLVTTWRWRLLAFIDAHRRL